jgi:hypothetical protein
VEAFKVKVKHISITITTGVHHHAPTATFFFFSSAISTGLTVHHGQTTPSAIHNGSVSEPLPLTIDPS